MVLKRALQTLSRRNNQPTVTPQFTQLAFVNGCIRVIVAPVEPVILQGGNARQTFSLGWSGNGAALEVPFAGCGAIEQYPRFRSRSGRLGRCIFGLRAGIGRWYGLRACARSRRCAAIRIAFEKELSVVSVDPGFKDAE